MRGFTISDGLPSYQRIFMIILFTSLPSDINKTTSHKISLKEIDSSNRDI